jgi:hypothetical protein
MKSEVSDRVAIRWIAWLDLFVLVPCIVTNVSHAQINARDREKQYPRGSRKSAWRWLKTIDCILVSEDATISRANNYGEIRELSNRPPASDEPNGERMAGKQ